LGLSLLVVGVLLAVLTAWFVPSVRIGADIWNFKPLGYVLGAAFALLGLRGLATCVGKLLKKSSDSKPPE
jgi:hypothetical protein